MPRPMPATALVVAMLAILLICIVTVPDDAAAAARPAAPPACTLLTPRQLQAVFGGTVGPGDLTTSPAGDESICTWTVLTSANGSGFSAQLDVKARFTPKEFKLQRQIASGPTKTVKHIGDSAFSERVKIGRQVFDDLWVHTGDIAFRLEVLEDLGSKPLVRLAPSVLAQLAAERHSGLAST